MADVLFTFPGRLGDNLLRVGIAYQYAMQHRCRVDLAFDHIWSAPLVPLLLREPWVDTAECIPGISSDPWGGQPWDFGRNWTQERWAKVYHLGYREHPGKWDDLTEFALKGSGVSIDATDLHEVPCLSYPLISGYRSLVVHVEASEGDHRIQEIRDAILAVWGSLIRSFERVWLLARPRCRYPHLYDSLRTEPKVSFFEDEGDFSRIAALLAQSLLVGTNSAIWALSRCLTSAAVCLVNADVNRVVPRPVHDRERVVYLGSGTSVLAEVESLVPGVLR